MKVPQIVIWLTLLVSFISASVAFYKFYIVRDYIVLANVPCDSTLHSCFVGDGDNTPQSYEEISKVANTIPACNGWQDQCPELTCDQGSFGCTITYCQLGTGDSCSGPTQTIN